MLRASTMALPLQNHMPSLQNRVTPPRATDPVNLLTTLPHPRLPMVLMATRLRPMQRIPRNPGRSLLLTMASTRPTDPHLHRRRTHIHSLLSRTLTDALRRNSTLLQGILVILSPPTRTITKPYSVVAAPGYYIASDGRRKYISLLLCSKLTMSPQEYPLSQQPQQPQPPPAGRRRG